MSGKNTAKLFQCTSDEFFSNYDTRQELSGRYLGLIFIDGLHLFEFALRDFMNAEQYCDGETIVIFHDTLPYTPEIAGRNPLPDNPAWTGDVWKIVEILEKYRPELYLQHVNVGPTGLLIVGNPSPQNQVLRQNYNNIIKEYMHHPLSPEGMENLRKPGFLREPEELLRWRLSQKRPVGANSICRAGAAAHSVIAQKNHARQRLWRRRAWCKTDRSRRSLKLRGDVIKGRGEVGPHQLKRADRGNRDQGGDQAVFDGGRAILVFPQFRQGRKHSSPSWWPLTSARCTPKLAKALSQHPARCHRAADRTRCSRFSSGISPNNHFRSHHGC
jgi:hypothetical protein